jgi:2',3'-cyclic-nucleotide 2'-phosphodiesterase (5'-nucleotidase family)
VLVARVGGDLYARTRYHDTVTFRLLHYSDIENAYDDVERIARLSGTLRALDGPDAIVCGTGDTTAPGVLALQTRGGQAIEFYERVGTRVETFGNHDFDFGIERTLELVDRSPQQWLASNIFHGDGEQRNARFGAEVGVASTAIYEVGESTVGFFGLTDPSTPDINPHAQGVRFTDPMQAADRAVEQLNEREVDHVVCLSHLGRDDDMLAERLDVDAILGGHIHSERELTIGETVLTRPGVNGAVVFEIELPSGVVSRHSVVDGPRDEELADRFQARIDTTGLEETVGIVETPIERTERSCFHGESRIGNFVADAYRWAAGRADHEGPLIGLQNAGGIREGPPLAGPVTRADLMSVIPFEESVAVLELGGAELLTTIAEADTSVGFGDAEADWWHAHISGAQVAYDQTTGTLREASVAGAPVEPTETYRVATSEYLLETPGEFPTLVEEMRIDTLDTQYEVLGAYAEAVGIDPSIEGRVIRYGAGELV